MKNRIEDYWMTRPDVLNLGYIHDLNHILTLYNISLEFKTCEALPRFGVLLSSKEDSQQILSILQNNSVFSRYIRESIKKYIDNDPLTFDEYQAQQNYLAIDVASYDDFLQFIHHPNIQTEFDNDFETFGVQPAENLLEGSSSRLLQFYTRYFKESADMLQRASVEELNQILRFVLSSTDYGLRELVYDSRIEFNVRKLAIESLYNLYANLFVHEPIEHHRYMLWDGLAYSYTMNHFTYQFSDEEKVPLQNVMFDTLCKILKLESIECQYASLHGLNHLRHPDTETVIRDYINTHELSDEDIEFAEDCIKFEVM